MKDAGVKFKLSALILAGLMVLASQVFGAARIINGTEVTESTQDDSYPWITALMINGSASCGASLIADQWVLTAAHCVTDEDTGSPMSASNFTVVVNDYDLRLQGDGESHTVTEVYVADGFDITTLDGDIAVLKLSSTVTSTPITLMSSSDFNALADNTALKVMGWGNVSISEDIYPNILREVDVNYANFSTCQEQYGAIGASVTSNMFCAGGDGETDSCQGDSGGPIMQLVNGEYQQVGIVSSGGTEEQSCAVKDYPGIYTRLSNYHSWISSVMAGNESPDSRLDGDTSGGDEQTSNSGKSSGGSLGGGLILLVLLLSVVRVSRKQT